jgi:hypothetical protein
VLLAQADKKFDKEGKLIDDIAKDLIREKLQVLKELILLQK